MRIAGSDMLSQIGFSIWVRVAFGPTEHVFSDSDAGSYFGFQSKEDRIAMASMGEPVLVSCVFACKNLQIWHINGGMGGGFEAFKHEESDGAPWLVLVVYGLLACVVGCAVDVGAGVSRLGRERSRTVTHGKFH